MSTAARFRSSASRLVRRFGGGATCTLRILATQPYNRDTRTRTPTYTDYVVRYALGQREVLDNRDVSVAKTASLRISVPASELPAGVLPKTDSKAVVAGVTYSVTKCDLVGATADNPAYFAIELSSP